MSAISLPACNLHRLGAMRFTPVRWRRFLLHGLVPAVLALSGCASDDERLGAIDPGPMDPTPVPEECALPDAGCPCENDGQEIECGTTAERFGNYVTCSMGTRTCEGATWGECVGTRKTLQALHSSSSTRHTLDLGVSGVCPVDFDPCDPYCNLVEDEPDDDLPIDDGFQIDDDGLTLIETGAGGCSELFVIPEESTMTVTAFDPLTLDTDNPLGVTAAVDPPSCTADGFETTWTVDRVDRATIAGSDSEDGELTLTTPVAGTIRVTAYALGLVASADIAVKVNVWEVPADDAAADPNYGADPTVATEFGTWDMPSAGTVASTVAGLYPYEDTHFPLGLLPPVVQYKYSTTAGTNPTMKISLRYPAGSTATGADFNYSLVVSETNSRQRQIGMSAAPDPQAIVPEAPWEYFSRTARGDDASIAIQRHKGGSGADQLEEETSRDIHFADGQLKGTVYYNSYNSVIGGSTATSVFGAVLKIGPNDTAPTVAAADTAGACTVCHTVSADGSSLITMSGYVGTIGCDGSTGGSNYRGNSCLFDMPAGSHDVTYTKGSSNQQKFNFGAPYPDGSFYLTNAYDNVESYADNSDLYRTSDGASLSSTDAPEWAVTPAFSPDGRAIAYNDAAGVTPPATPADVVLSEYGPCRSSSGSSNWEFAELRNDGGTSADIGGWYIRQSGGSTCFSVPGGTTLDSGDTYVMDLFGSCMGDTGDTIRLYDAGGTQQDSDSYSWGGGSSCTSWWGKRRRYRDCSDSWSSTGGNSEDSGNDSCAAGSSSPTPSPDMASEALKMMDFDCGAASGSTTCTGSKVFSNEELLVDCASSTCEVPGYPSFLPDNSGVLYQHVMRGGKTSVKANDSSVLVSRLNTWQGALAEIWLAAPGEEPTRLDALNGYDSGGSNYLPEVPRDVSTPTNFSSSFHSASGATTGWVYDKCAGSSSTTTSNSLEQQSMDENQVNYIPMVSPQEAGDFYWVIFTSRRMYGNVAISSPWQAERSDNSSNYYGNFNSSGNCRNHNAYGPGSGLIETKKLWIAAVDKDWTPGTDPSHPAFYLPGQELEAGNSHGYWVATECVNEGDTCETNDDCCGGTGDSPTSQCRTSVSGSTVTKACAAIDECSTEGDSCDTTDDCCTGLTCPDGGGVCVNIPIAVFETQIYEREYVAECPQDTHVEWQFFEWRSTIPDDTSIDFYVQTKNQDADDYEPDAALLYASSTVSTDQDEDTWVHGSETIDQILVDEEVGSRSYLLVSMVFNPDADGLAAPTLNAWRMIYDCVPAE